MHQAFLTSVALKGEAAPSSRASSPRFTLCANHNASAPRIGRRRALALVLAATISVGPSIYNVAYADGKQVQLSEAEWRDRLSPAAYGVLRESKTERPFSSSLNYEKRKGTFVCAGCSAQLFSSETKFESGTGWPSFFDVIPRSVTYHRTPTDFLLARTEVCCATCNGHLGHVFDDGPRPTGKRFCMNGVALSFVPDKA